LRIANLANIKWEGVPDFGGYYPECTLPKCVPPCINSPKITSLGAIIVHAMSCAFTLALARLSCILLWGRWSM